MEQIKWLHIIGVKSGLTATLSPEKWVKNFALVLILNGWDFYEKKQVFLKKNYQFFSSGIKSTKSSDVLIIFFLAIQPVF